MFRRRLRQFWCWLWTGHYWDRVGDRSAITRKYTLRCSSCGALKTGPARSTDISMGHAHPHTGRKKRTTNRGGARTRRTDYE